MSSISRPELSSRWWKSSRPEAVLGRKLETALKRYESLEDGDDPSALRAALESLSSAAAEAAKDCAREEEHDVEDALRDLARLIARRRKECCEHEADEEDEEEEEVDGLDPESLRTHMRLLAKGPLPFAFGVGNGGVVAFALDRKRKGPSLMSKLKQASGCTSATFGLASVEGKELVLDVEGPALSGIAKKLRTFLRENQPLPYTQVRVAGIEDVEDEDPAEEPEQPRKPEPTLEDDPPLNMIRPYEISGSVGAGGKNHPDDVQMVQSQLNRLARAGLEVDGQIGPKTIEAIKAFQRSLGFTSPDGRVDPGQTTDRALAGQKVEPPKQYGGGGGKQNGGGYPREPRERRPREIEEPYDGDGVERIHDQGYDEPGGGELKEAKELARRVLQQKQSADKRMQDLKRAAAGKPGAQSQRIVGRMEEVYGRGTLSVREVTQRMKELSEMDHSTERSVREQQVADLRRAAELALQGFQAVESGVGKGLEWMETRLQDVDARE